MESKYGGPVDFMASRERLTPTERQTKKRLKLTLESKLADLERLRGSMDVTSWEYQEGIIISGNDAKFILEKW